MTRMLCPISPDHTTTDDTDLTCNQILLFTRSGHWLKIPLPGIEPGAQTWKACMLPTTPQWTSRHCSSILTTHLKCQQDRCKEKRSDQPDSNQWPKEFYSRLQSSALPTELWSVSCLTMRMLLTRLDFPNRREEMRWDDLTRLDMMSVLKIHFRHWCQTVPDAKRFATWHMSHVFWCLTTPTSLSQLPLT